MANVHGLFSGRNDDDDSEDERENRFVGGISARGGGRYVVLCDTMTKNSFAVAALLCALSTLE